MSDHLGKPIPKISPKTMGSIVSVCSFRFRLSNIIISSF
ncbi:hypothetical protein SAG0029_02700 [Streptococcus agalactiae FSL S3-501]|nr:hypothetical protein SAG0029_02700 [Streptococcus agalactiae FSL S3-501]